jgi:hypothetical protein
MKRSALALMAISVLVPMTVQAQDQLRGPDGRTSNHVSGVELLAVPDRPFSGKSNIEWTRILEDGSTITTHLQANLARDSKGRIYRERRSFVPANSSDPAPLNEIHITDPTTRTQTVCSIRAMQWIISGYVPQTFFNSPPTGPYADGTRYRTREELGTNQMNGFEVTGSRETRTINSGVIGNDRSLVSAGEFWYNADLQTNLQVIRTGPDIGKQVIKLTDISVSEPNPELFKIPIGYSVRDSRRIQRIAP